MSFSLQNVYTNPQSEVNTNDKPCEIKGLKKSSVGQIGHDPNSAHEKKLLKWNDSINLIKKKSKKNNRSTYTKKKKKKTDAQHLRICGRLLFKHQITA